MSEPASGGGGPATRRLALLRHAKSGSDDPELEDHARGLAPRGVSAAGAMSRYIRERGLPAELVLCSSALRTRETLRIVESSLEPPTEVRVEDELYLPSLPKLLERLTRVADHHRSVLLIGHNPGLEDLALSLCDEKKARNQLERGFATCALAEIELAIDGWKALGPGVGRLLRFTRPADLT